MVADDNARAAHESTRLFPARLAIGRRWPDVIGVSGQRLVGRGEHFVSARPDAAFRVPDNPVASLGGLGAFGRSTAIKPPGCRCRSARYAHLPSRTSPTPAHPLDGCQQSTGTHRRFHPACETSWLSPVSDVADSSGRGVLGSTKERPAGGRSRWGVEGQAARRQREGRSRALIQFLSAAGVAMLKKKARRCGPRGGC